MYTMYTAMYAQCIPERGIERNKTKQHQLETKPQCNSTTVCMDLNLNLNE